MKRDLAPTKDLVSLIVTSRNEREDIENCLRSLLDQDYPNTEVILVDNGSTDGTIEIASRLDVRVENRGPERSAQRNHGFAVSRGEYVCFLDADMITPPTMVAECVACMADPAVGAVVIPEESFGEGFWTRCKILERSCYPPGSYMEAARFFRGEVFQQLGGFDENLTGLEDLDLHQRCLDVTRIGHTGTPISHHEGRIKFLGQLRKKFRYGRQSFLYAKGHPTAFRKQGNPFRAYFFKGWKILVRNPMLSFAMLFLKSSELTAGGIGVTVGWLKCRHRVW